MRILTLFLRYGTEKYVGAEERLNEIFSEQLPGVDRQIVVIDNSMPTGTVIELEPDRVVIGGDNSAWEFSGWEQGVRWVGRRLRSFDLVHLATSAFETNYIGYLSKLCAPALEIAVDRPVVLGHIDCYNEPVQLLEYTFQHWIRSCCVFLTPSELLTLRSLVSLKTPGALFTGNFRDPFRLLDRRGAPLVSEQYQQNILNWLTGEGTGQGTTWHSRFALSEKTLPFFEQKSAAIFNEHLLSARLRAQGCALVDLTWLYGKIAAGEAVDLHSPWYVQLRERFVDAVCPPLLAA